MHGCLEMAIVLQSPYKIDATAFVKEHGGARTQRQIFEAEANDYSPAWGDVSVWLPQHVFEERGMPIGDPVCMRGSAMGRGVVLQLGLVG